MLMAAVTVPPLRIQFRLRPKRRATIAVSGDLPSYARRTVSEMRRKTQRGPTTSCQKTMVPVPSYQFR